MVIWKQYLKRMRARNLIPTYSINPPLQKETPSPAVPDGKHSIATADFLLMTPVKMYYRMIAVFLNLIQIAESILPLLHLEIWETYPRIWMSTSKCYGIQENSGLQRKRQH